MKSLIEAFALQDRRVVAIVGAGGKTSLMTALAREWVARGERVLLSTTTKLARDEVAGVWPLIAAEGADDMIARAVPMLARPGDAALAYAGDVGDGMRIRGFDGAVIDAAAAAGVADRLVVECDGSKRLPLKAPGDHEPVVPACADAVIAVAGLHALGRTLDAETVFRPAVFAELSGLAEGAPITPEALARVACHPRGLLKGTPPGAARALYLNRADGPERLGLADAVIAAWRAAGASEPRRVVAGCLKPDWHLARLELSREA